MVSKGQITNHAATYAGRQKFSVLRAKRLRCTSIQEREPRVVRASGLSYPSPGRWPSARRRFAWPWPVHGRRNTWMTLAPSWRKFKSSLGVPSLTIARTRNIIPGPSCDLWLALFGIREKLLSARHINLPVRRAAANVVSRTLHSPNHDQTGGVRVLLVSARAVSELW